MKPPLLSKLNSYHGDNFGYRLLFFWRVVPSETPLVSRRCLRQAEHVCGPPPRGGGGGGVALLALAVAGVFSAVVAVLVLGLPVQQRVDRRTGLSAQVLAARLHCQASRARRSRCGGLGVPRWRPKRAVDSHFHQSATLETTLGETYQSYQSLSVPAQDRAGCDGQVDTELRTGCLSSLI